MLPSGRISLLFIHSFVLIRGELLWLVTVRSFTGRKCPGFGPQRAKTPRKQRGQIWNI